MGADLVAVVRQHDLLLLAAAGTMALMFVAVTDHSPVRQRIAAVGVGMMLTVIALALAVAGRTETIVLAGSVDSHNRLVERVSVLEQRLGIPPGRCVRLVRYFPESDLPAELLLAVAVVESTCRMQDAHGGVITSSAGARCFMQIMPFHVDDVRVLDDPYVCARVGTRILEDRVERYGLFDGVARYNGAGPEAERYAVLVMERYAQLSTLCAAFPLESGWIIKPFGVPVNYQAGGWHTGIDITGPKGAYVLAAADGVVVHVGPLYCRGNCGRGEHAVVIRHNLGVYTIYSHNREALVRVGDRVVRGQRIAVMGNEGFSYGDHLHFEVYVGGRWTGDWRRPFDGGLFINPEKILCKGG